MLIGEIFVQVGWVKPSELTSGLDYAHAKCLPIGRVLKILKTVDDEQVNLALRAQALIRLGLDSGIAMQTLSEAYQEQLPFDAVLTRLRDGGNLSREHKNNGQVAPKKPTSSMTVNWPASTTAATTTSTPGVTPLQSLVTRAEILAREGRYQEADLAYVQAIAEDARTSRSRLDTRELLAKYAHFLVLSENFSAGEAIHQQIVGISLSELPKDDPQIPKVLLEFADFYITASNLSAAADLLLKAADAIELRLPRSLADYLHTLRKLSGVAKPTAVPKEQLRIGALLVDAKLLDEQLLQEGLVLSKKSGMPIGSALHELGHLSTQVLSSVMYCQLVLQDGKLSSAVATRCLRLACLQNMDLKDVLVGANILAREQESPEFQETAVNIDLLLALESGGQGDSLSAAAIEMRLGELHAARDSANYAEFSYRRALAIYMREAPNTVQAAKCAHGLANVLIDRNRLAEAHKVLSDSLHSLKITESLESSETLRLLAIVEYKQGSYANALSFGQSALAVMDKLAIPGNADRLFLLENLSDCASDCNNLDLAIGLRSKAIELQRKLHGDRNEDFAVSLEKLGDLYSSAAKNEFAVRQYYMAQRILMSLPDGAATARASQLMEKIAQVG